jgi:hypothetical protein
VFAIVVALLVAAVLISVAIFGISVRSDNLNGFGPDWECTNHPQGEPTCIKRVKP